MRVREDLLSRAGGVPVGPCARCEREVIGCTLGDAGPAECFTCVHCDFVLRHVEWIDESELASLGYDLRDPLAGPGCGSGCASGGCAARAPG